MNDTTLAYAIACGYSSTTRRPILGEITINSNGFDPNSLP